MMGQRSLNMVSRGGRARAEVGCGAQLGLLGTRVTRGMQGAAGLQLGAAPELEALESWVEP